LRGGARHGRYERGCLVVAVGPEAVVRLRSADGGEGEPDSEHRDERSHCGTSRSKRSTNAPAGAVRRRYNAPRASRNRASGAVSVHESDPIENCLTPPRSPRTSTTNSSRSSVYT